MIRIASLYKKNLIMTDRYAAFFTGNLVTGLRIMSDNDSATANQQRLESDSPAAKLSFNPKRITTHVYKNTFFRQFGGFCAFLGLYAGIHSATAADIAGSASLTLPSLQIAQLNTAPSALSDEAIRNAPVQPRTRPAFSDAWGGQPVLIALPLPRPSLADMLPQSTRELSDMVSAQTGQQTEAVLNLTLKRGNTLASLLKKAHFTAQDIAQISDSLSRHINLRRLQIGTGFTVALSAEKKPVGLQLHLPNPQRLDENAGADGFIDHYVLYGVDEGTETDSATASGWTTIKALRPVQTAYVHAGNQIDVSLYKAAIQAKIPLSALDEFVTVMGFSIDFQREIRKGDTFELVYEKSVDGLTGNAISTGNVHYAGVVLSGNKMGFYRFVHRNGRVGWYDRNGNSAVRTLMRTPVNGARISSGFGMRRHPISGFNAMHKGVDFAVPTGTPILAAGSGVVESVGWNGGYGKYIRIRHNSTYKTAYAHLNGYARGISRGAVVEQGQTIGYVGSTGRSTGPHLHYEILVNNRKVNPLTVKLPTGKSIEASEKEAFFEQVARIESQLKHSTTPQYAGMTFIQPVF